MDEGERNVEQTDALGRPMREEERTSLPQVGIKFYVEGVEYKVTYVNEGKRRFSATPTQ